MNRSRLPARAIPLLILFSLIAAPSLIPAQEVHPITVNPLTTWELPKKKVTSLTEFFALLPEMEIPRVGKRMFIGNVSSAKVEEDGNAIVTFQFVREEFSMLLPSRASTTLNLPLRGMGNPFVVGQTWSIFFDGGGDIVRLQLETVMTHYRKRGGGRVEVRIHDFDGRTSEVVPTTVMPPEAEYEDGFFGYVDIFRDAGMVAGGDAVGGPGILELESISLPDAEPILEDGLEPDSAPWTAIRDGGMEEAIPDYQRFAY